MADDAQYGSGADTGTMKRKYEEQTAPALASTRRATGFSAPIISSGPDSGHVPVDDIELAKQKAQEIAARLFSSASSLEAKRPRVENGGDGGGGGGGGYDYNDKGFSSIPSDYSQTHTMSTPASYGFQGSSKKVQIPNGRVGVIIGKAGETIKYLQLQSGAKIQVTRDADAEPGSNTRAVDLVGTPEAIAKAEQLINDVLSEAESGSSGQGPRRGTGPSGFADQFVMKIPNNKVGLVIGKGGETIKNMQATTGARIQVIPLHPPPGDTSLERTLQIDGTSEQIESAKLLVNEVISENRPRNSSMGGGYSQQGYQARPPTNWSQPGPPMQQYGYVQPGAYSGPTPQYQQQSYGAYPNQPNSGGYSSNQSIEGSGYDYYNQQQSTQQQPSQGGPGSTDTTGYNYNQQQQAAGYTQQGQGYSQDGYSTGYPPPQSGYNQQPQGYDQQGYNASYGTQGGTTQAPPTAQPSASIQQGYAGQQPAPNQPSYPSQPGYGVPPTAQSGYGTQQSGYGTGYAAPQAQKSPAGQSAFGQTQQSPTAQGAYGQPGYPPSHTGYAQPDSTKKQSPSSLTPPAQSGYGVPPPYGATGYAQQPPPYNSAYGSGYVQPLAYSANATAGGTPQSGAPKASPQS